MITISTGGIGPIDITPNTKSKGTSKEEKASDAFASLMNMVSTNQDNAAMVDKTEQDVTDVAPQKDVSKEYEAYKKQENVDASKDKLGDVEKTTTKEDTEVSKSTESIEETDEEIQTCDKVVALVKQVKETLKDSLGLSEEQIDDILADMGITAGELLLGDNLKNFILQAEGATNVDLLVNEELSNLVSDLNAEITQIISDSSLDLNFDIQNYIKDNSVMIDQLLKESKTNVDNTIDSVLLDNTVEVVEQSKDVIGKNDAVLDGDYNVVSEAAEEKTPEMDSKKAGPNKIEQSNTQNPESDVVKSTEQNNQPMGHEHFSEQTGHQIHANLNQAIDNVVNDNANITSFSGNVQEADIIRQIIDQVKVNVGKDIQSMEVQLNPENLGKVYVNVEAKEGVMQAKIIAETEAAKNAIENNLAILKDNFSNSEIKVEAIEVMVAAYGFFEESQNGNFDNQEQTNDTSKSVGIISVNGVNEDELTEEEALEVEIMKTQGNTVSYTV